MINGKFQREKLKKVGIVIETKYKTDSGIAIRSSNNFKKDDVVKGIIIEKNYYRNGVLLKKENCFDSRILYTFSFDQNYNKSFSCPNCGKISSIDECEDGCPYCGTFYNIEYEYKDLGNKYYYDLSINDSKYVLKTCIIDVLFSFAFSFAYFVSTGRSFLHFDFAKIIIATLLLSSILFFVFYYANAFFILPFVKRKKQKSNEIQKAFWNKMSDYNIDKSSFYNNFNYDLQQYFYDKNSLVIDYDIIDYNSFEEINNKDGLSVKVDFDVRIVRYEGDKIVSKVERRHCILKKNDSYNKLNAGTNIMTCPKCGASIDVTEEKCRYCGFEVNYVKQWYLVDLS